MSEIKDTTRNTRTFEINIDEETKKELGGYMILSQLNRQIIFSLEEEDKWYVESYRTKKNNDGTTTYLVKVVVIEAQSK